MPVRIGWVLKDLSQDPDEVYNWQVNPNEFSLPYQKTLSYSNTAAPDGRVLIYEGRDEVQKIQFSGVILEQDQYEDLVYWFNKRHQLQLIDDLGREMFVYITSFSTQRKRSVQYPWRHTYNGEMIILDWA